jgi:hypothetical protein
MKSEEINQIIASWDGKDNLPYESFGGKAIPYIGWFWRDVDFDSNHCWLGILPICQDVLDPNDKRRAGFMQNNKWGYEEYIVEGEIWKEIKRLIEIAVQNPTKENLEAVDNFIQETLPKEKEAGRWRKSPSVE